MKKEVDGGNRGRILRETLRFGRGKLVEGRFKVTQGMKGIKFKRPWIQHERVNQLF